MAKKSGAKVPASKLNQKLGTGSAPASGMGLGSKLEGAAAIKYAGYNQGPVKHGAHGLLAGTGGKKNQKVPQG